MHVRVGTPRRFLARRLQIAARLAVLQMPVEERKRLLAQPQRIRIAAEMRPASARSTQEWS